MNSPPFHPEPRWNTFESSTPPFPLNLLSNGIASTPERSHQISPLANALVMTLVLASCPRLVVPNTALSVRAPSAKSPPDLSFSPHQDFSFPSGLEAVMPPGVSLSLMLQAFSTLTIPGNSSSFSSTLDGRLLMSLTEIVLLSWYCFHALLVFRWLKYKNFQRRNAAHKDSVALGDKR